MIDPALANRNSDVPLVILDSMEQAIPASGGQFASLLTALTATLGLRFVEDKPTWWALTLLTGNLILLGTAVGLAVVVLLPREYLALGIDYSAGFQPGRRSSSLLNRSAERQCVASSRRSRESALANDGKARLVRWAYLALAAALVLTIAEAVTLGWNKVS